MRLQILLQKIREICDQEYTELDELKQAIKEINDEPFKRIDYNGRSLEPKVTKSMYEWRIRRHQRQINEKSKVEVQFEV